MTKFIDISDISQEAKGTVFNMVQTFQTGWKITTQTPIEFEVVKYLGKCKVDGDLFIAWKEGTHWIFKGVKGYEFVPSSSPRIGNTNYIDDSIPGSVADGKTVFTELISLNGQDLWPAHCQPDNYRPVVYLGKDIAGTDLFCAHHDIKGVTLYKGIKGNEKYIRGI